MPQLGCVLASGAGVGFVRLCISGLGCGILGGACSTFAFASSSSAFRTSSWPVLRRRRLGPPRTTLEASRLPTIVAEGASTPPSIPIASCTTVHVNRSLSAMHGAVRRSIGLEQRSRRVSSFFWTSRPFIVNLRSCTSLIVAQLNSCGERCRHGMQGSLRITHAGMSPWPYSAKWLEPKRLP